MDELSHLEHSFLAACCELVRRQQELVPQLASLLGVAPEELFYSWMDRRFPGMAQLPEEDRRLQTGEITDTGWAYFFHGFECDLKHNDGRLVRVEFGPRGRIDTFTEYAVLQFVMASRLPWPEFTDLKTYLADRPPPYDEYAGSYSRAIELFDALEERGFLEAAAPDLVQLLKDCTTTGPNGQCMISFPESIHERMQLDCLRSARAVLSEKAQQALAHWRTTA